MFEKSAQLHVHGRKTLPSPSTITTHNSDDSPSRRMATMPTTMTTHLWPPNIDLSFDARGSIVWFDCLSARQPAAFGQRPTHTWSVFRRFARSPLTAHRSLTVSFIQSLANEWYLRTFAPCFVLTESMKSECSYGIATSMLRRWLCLAAVNDHSCVRSSVRLAASCISRSGDVSLRCRMKKLTAFK